MRSEDIFIMKDKVATFGNVYKEYFRGQLKDENILSDVTQSYWQSMYLSRQRLNKLGIGLDMEIENTDRGIIETASYDSDGKRKVGTFKQPVKIRKRYFKNGNQIAAKKEKKLNIASVIKSEGNETGYACPNCGSYLPIETYIDGCDYCGSKFEIDDFREKISSYSIEEDSDRKTKGIFKKVFFGVLGAFLGFIALLVIAIAILVISCILGVGMNESTEMVIGMSYLISIKMIPVAFYILLAYLVLFFALCGRYVKQSFRRVDDTNALRDLKRMNKNFSAEKFAENLEFKLKNIHFAENAEEVNAFANFDMSSVISEYSNVVECNLENIAFLDFRKIQDQDFDVEFKVRVKLTLTRFVNGKIKEEGEKVVMLIKAKENTLDYNLENVRIHKCGGCGMNVSLLNGGVCEFCGNKLDYKQYSFMIDSYYSNCDTSVEKTGCSAGYADNKRVIFGKEKVKSLAAKLRIRMGAFIAVATVVACGVFYVSSAKYFYVYFHYDEYIDKITEGYKDIKTIDEVVDDVEVIKETQDSFNVEYTCKGYYRLASEDYAEYLLNEGFEYYHNFEEEKFLVRRTDVGEDIGFELYMCVSIKKEGNQFVVKYETEEYDYLYGEE